MYVNEFVRYKSGMADKFIFQARNRISENRHFGKACLQNTISGEGIFGSGWNIYS